MRLRRIRGVLNERWDPRGLAGRLDDAYDSYIDGVHALLVKHASDEAIARHLQGLEVGAMGINGTPFERLLRVAIDLRQLLTSPPSKKSTRRVEPDDAA